MDSDFSPISEVDINNKLPPGMFEVKVTREGQVFFTKIKANHDSLVDLPDTEYDTVVGEIDLFMKPETREKFEKKGFLYKRSTLLHGLPGTGKTCIVNRVISKVIEEGGVALFCPNPAFLSEAFNILDSIQPDTRVMVIFEEIDETLKRHESELLNILDGEIQKQNVIYMATTNHIEKIPKRIRRPGRFSSVIEVKYPSPKTREYYLKNKFGVLENLQEWIEKTEGFSIDELKECVLAVHCLNYSLDSIADRVRANKGDFDKPKNCGGHGCLNRECTDCNTPFTSGSYINPF